MTAMPPAAPQPIVIPRGRRSAAERRLAAIAALHQPVMPTGPAADLLDPGCGQCRGGRWPCSTALLLGDWPRQQETGQSATRLALPVGKAKGGTQNHTSVPKYAASRSVVGGLGSLRVVGMRTCRTDRGPPASSPGGADVAAWGTRPVGGGCGSRAAWVWYVVSLR